MNEHSIHESTAEILETKLESAWKELDSLKATLNKVRDRNLSLKYCNEILLAQLSTTGKFSGVDLGNNFPEKITRAVKSVSIVDLESVPLIQQISETYPPELIKLKKYTDELMQELNSTKEEFICLKTQLKEERELLHEQENYKEILLAHLNAEEKVTVVIDNCRKIPEWLKENFSGKILVLNRAQDKLKYATDKDIPLIKDAFEVLEIYWNMRNGLTAKSEFDRRLNELHLVKERTISDNRAGEQDETYYVKDDNGKRRKLEWHLKRGRDRDKQEYFLRVYFYWDKERNLVVVGDLLEHLKTRQS